MIFTAFKSGKNRKEKVRDINQPYLNDFDI